MNTISIVIITAFLNVIITGIVSNLIFYRYQKRIEDSFAKSMLEYQTRFVRNQEKTLETLETIYQKFSEFRLEVNRHLFAKLSALTSGEEVNLEDEIKSSFSKADQLLDYFVGQRIYLPQNSLTEIGDVLTKTKLLYSVFSMGLLIFENPRKSPQFLDALIIMMNTWEMKFD